MNKIIMATIEARGRVDYYAASPIGDYPANIDLIPGERRVKPKGASIAGVAETINEMIDNGDDVIEMLFEGAKTVDKENQPKKYVIAGAEASSLGPEGQIVRWWKRPGDWVKDHKEEPKKWVKDHKRELIIASEVAAAVAGVTTTATVVAIDIMHHIKQRKG